MKNFYFNKTELFEKIKNIESFLKINGVELSNSISISTRLQNIENTLNSIQTTYATKTYVDNNLLTKLSKTGDTLLANISLLVEPIDSNHLTNVQYVLNIRNSILQTISQVETNINNL